MARRKCTGKCNWITSSKKGVTAECDECGDVFPCKSECGHIDCHLEKARKCYVCGKRISNKTPANFYLVDGKGTACYLVHKECAEDTRIVKVDEI